MNEKELVRSPATPPTGEPYVLVLLVRDRGNALERVLGILRRRGPSFSTVSVAATEAPDTARITITLQGTRTAADRVIEHLRKLVDVRWATVLPTSGSSERLLLRELALIRVMCDGQTRREVMALAEQFGARVVDIADGSLTLEVSGVPDTIERLLGLVRPFGICELTRTGRVAI